MKTLFRNISELYTFQGFHEKDGRHPGDEDWGRIPKGALLVEKGRILWAGPEREVKKALVRWAGTSSRKISLREVDLGGAIVFPALTECHTHLVFAGDRSEEFELRTRGASYQEIAARGGGILSTMKATRAATAGVLRDLAQKRIDEFVRQGVTTVESKTGYGLDSASEIKCLEVMKKLRGPRVVPTFLGAHARPPEFPEEESYLRYLQEKLLPIIRKKRLAERVDIFVEKGFFSKEAARSFLTFCREQGFSLTIHADQMSLSGGSELGIELKALSIDHAIQISDELIGRLAASSTTGVLLPTADLYLKCPFPPARKMVDQGCRIALATDFNPGSAPCQDVQTVGLLARLEMKLHLPEVFCAYTFGAASALGLREELGSLTAGKRADFVVTETPLREWFYSPGRQLATKSFIQGRQLHNA